VPGGNDFISVDEAAIEFHRSRKTIFGWLKEGRLTRYRSEGDRRTLVSRRELRDLVEPRPER
jgi:excisionase family DNA binding protein